MRIRHVSQLSEPEKDRIFAHGLHEEGVFYNRLNFFLVFESLVVAAVVSGFSRETLPPPVISISIGLLGLTVSLLWWFVQVNKLVLLDTLEKRSLEAHLEFKENVWLANEKQWMHTRDANKLLAHGLPLIFTLGWLVILTYSLWSAWWASRITA